MDKALTKWSDDLRTEIIWQDYQHQELLQNMNSLHQSIFEKRSGEQISRTVAFLDFYVKDHFGLEEKYMETFQYPERESHSREHAIFADKMERFKSAYVSQGGTMPAMKLCFDLNEWFANHIKTTDKKLGLFLGQKI